MADLLFGRRLKLTVLLPVKTEGNFTDTQTTDVYEVNSDDSAGANSLRVQGAIAKSNQKEPNRSEIKVTNLSEDTRSRLQIKGAKVVVEAGYQSTGVQRLIRADVRTIDHVRDGADWVTTMKLGDGERAYRHARVQQSFSGGTGAGDVLKYLVNESGLQKGNIDTIVPNVTTTFEQGYVVSGQWSREMDRLVKSLGLVWCIHDETIQVLEPGAPLQDPLNQGKVISKDQLPDITPETGLIGSPEMGTPESKKKPALLKFTSLLFPAVPNGLVHISSKRYRDATVRAIKVDHSFDTHGNEWYTEVRGVVHGG